MWHHSQPATAKMNDLQSSHRMLPQRKNKTYRNARLCEPHEWAHCLRLKHASAGFGLGLGSKPRFALSAKR